jgi:hypothetical protein
MKKKISFVYDLTNEYCVFGICSHMKDYKLCWNLNKVLNIDLSKYEDFSSSEKKSASEKFSFFYYNDQNYRNNIFLLSNKKNNITLFEKIPDADYLLMIKGQISAKKTDGLISALKKTSNILTVFIVNMEKIKEMNNFLTEIELHQMSVLKKIV